MAGRRRLYRVIRARRSLALFVEPVPQRQEVADGERGLLSDAQVLGARPRVSPVDCQTDEEANIDWINEKGNGLNYSGI